MSHDYEILFLLYLFLQGQIIRMKTNWTNPGSDFKLKSSWPCYEPVFSSLSSTSLHAEHFEICHMTIKYYSYHTFKIKGKPEWRLTGLHPDADFLLKSSWPQIWTQHYPPSCYVLNILNSVTRSHSNLTINYICKWLLFVLTKFTIVQTKVSDLVVFSGNLPFTCFSPKSYHLLFSVWLWKTKIVWTLVCTWIVCKSNPALVFCKEIA